MEARLGPKRVSKATGKLEAPAAMQVSLSSGESWRGMRLDQVLLAPAEESEGYFPHHAVIVYPKPLYGLEISTPGENTRVVDISAGAVSLIPAGVPYRSRWQVPCELIIVRLQPDGQDSVMPESSRSLSRVVVGADDELLRDLVLALRKEVQRGADGSPLYAQALGSAMGAHLVRRYGAPILAETRRKGGLPGRRLQELRAYVEQHLSSPLHLPQLAQLAGSSVRQFARAFKESTALTPHQFVLLRRIERAKTLLAGSTLTVTDIAQACGFASTSRFTSAFRRVTRSTPTAYRSMAD
jgi:AraC family transcriptional regulator